MVVQICPKLCIFVRPNSKSNFGQIRNSNVFDSDDHLSFWRHGITPGMSLNMAKQLWLNISGNTPPTPSSPFMLCHPHIHTDMQCAHSCARVVSLGVPCWCLSCLRQLTLSSAPLPLPSSRAKPLCEGRGPGESDWSPPPPGLARGTAPSVQVGRWKNQYDGWRWCRGGPAGKLHRFRGHCSLQGADRAAGVKRERSGRLQ